MLSQFRHKVDPHAAKFWAPLGRWVKPNQLTVLGLILAGVAGYFIYTDKFIWGGIFVLISATLDHLDGALARGAGLTSEFGAVLDAVFDRLGEGLIYIGLATQSFLAVPAIILSYGISHASAKNKKAGGGILERIERAFFIAVILFINQVETGLLIFNILLFITLFQRMYYVYRDSS
ncbi:MAG: CDP-alcohol phosphatidyltransferase family protein [Candidatus Altiarchaeota archaeon]|nr:CDP-alcohol phosphatidyltransferase family protein [Candidatus Altiarchaeota archaeon]